MSARGRSRDATLRELPLVRQNRGNDCGPAALATIAAYHGCRFDYDDFSRELILDRHGTDLHALSRIAERLGFQVQGIKASYDAIPRCTLPAIAHIRHRLGGGHFVVLQQWNSTHVVIADPAAGLRTLSRSAFSQRSTGYLLLIQPAPTRRSPRIGARRESCVGLPASTAICA